LGNYTRLEALFYSLLERFDLVRFKSIQLTADSREAKLLTNINKNLALKVQLLGQGKYPDLLVFFGFLFRLRIRQAELLWRCSERPRTYPQAKLWVYWIDRPRPRTSYILIPRLAMKRGVVGSIPGIQSPVFD
jgi:hypothetical protein